jgi:hypothetical protein
VGTNNTGSVRFVNSAFWGPCNQIALIAGRGPVGFSDCTFVQWDRKKEGRPALQVEGGSLIVRGCEFQENKPQLSLGPAVKRAVITDNLIRGRLNISNQCKGQVVLRDNPSDTPPTDESK